jgi:hypothetical protein
MEDIYVNVISTCLIVLLIFQYYIFYLKVEKDYYPNKKQMLMDFIPLGMYF